MINSRLLSDLTPECAKLCQLLITRCKEVGIDLLITSTYRDFESQNALYVQGRTKPGNKVTNAKGGMSFHNYRVAFDFVPVVNGKAQWNDVKTFAQVGAIAKSIGLEWAGDWVKFKELAHCQMPGLSLAALSAQAH